MERHFDTELKRLKDQILAMGGYVERAIDVATSALVNRDAAGLKDLPQIEEKINQAHMEVDEVCLRLLAKQSPLAQDLRLVLGTIKINTDLERMGDQAVNISQNAAIYLKSPQVKPLVDLPRMAEAVRLMVRDSLDAFVRTDETLAREVLRADDLVDDLKRKILSELIAIMKTDSQTIDAALALILIARNLERIGDHATNVAEDVIFIASGADIRHGGVKVKQA